MGKRARRGGMVALMCHADHVRAEPELEQELRRVGHEANDAHPMTLFTLALGVSSLWMATLSEAEIAARLSGLEGWGEGADASITREFSFADFAAAVAFVNRVAQAAEEQNHHPDILIHGWNKVRLTLSTHSEGGVTEADFQLAARLGSLA